MRQYQGFELFDGHIADHGKSQLNKGQYIQTQLAPVEVGLVASDEAFILQAFEASPARRHAQRQVFCQLRIGQSAVLLQQVQNRFILTTQSML